MSPANEKGETRVVVVENEELQTKVASLSLNSVVVLNLPKILKVWGHIVGMDVVILIDNGATDNFIFEEIMNILQYSTTPSLNYGVVFGFGGAIKATSDF